MPPHRHLHLQDLDACVRYWEALRPEALAALAEGQLQLCGAAASGRLQTRQAALDALVRRFRNLREALTSAAGAGAAPSRGSAAPNCGTAVPRLAVEVYEMAADVCGLAGDSAELLKCLQGLANSVYPAAEAAAEAAGGGEAWERRGEWGLQARGAADNPWGDNSSDGGGVAEAAVPPRARAPPAAARGALVRQAEVQAALLLWFLAVPARPVPGEVAKRLRATPPALLAAPELQLALAAASALMRGNWVRLAAAADAAPPLVARVLQAGAPAARARAARAAAAAYRSLPWPAFCAALGLGGGGGDSGGGEWDAARAALERARDALGCRGAAVALERLAGGGGAELVFR
ncbi:MAG: hypothetical protein J3K34DRAFT_516806 [Monoraphidium minutum]|nr:MAG: hypothetical protein J3K34DRAFT_516806 [Monoraphidium minutum]